GDIMSARETSIVLPPEFGPMERVLLTANGNVQRILSAFYNSPVTVEVLRNDLVPESQRSHPLALAEYDREVQLLVSGNVCCTATSTVRLMDKEHLELVAEKHVGIGQLFRYLNVLPAFELLELGRGEGFFWRLYTLASSGVHCEIKEVFPDDVFALGSVPSVLTGVVPHGLSPASSVWDFRKSA
ncbi:hypothetical protein HK405_015250, partial [Cladochytrium tenue]